MRVIAMFRVSTERQANEGASLDSQERTFRELARNNRWKVVGEFRGCESATQAATERKVLQQVLACIGEQKPDAVYIHEQSRLTRGDELEVRGREARPRGASGQRRKRRPGRLEPEHDGGERQHRHEGCGALLVARGTRRNCFNTLDPPVGT